MMKRICYIVLLCLLTAMPLWAQTRINGEPSMRGLSSRHFTSRDIKRQRDSRGLFHSKETGEQHTFGFYGIGAYSNIFGGPDILKAKPGGYDGRFGMVYEYRQGLLMIQTGIGVSFREIRNNVGDMRFTLMQLHGQIPLLAGMHMYGFYIMGGLTFTFPFLQETTAEMNVTSRGSYDRYYGMEGEWMEMDNHGYRELVPIKKRNDHTDKRFDVLFTLETGYDWTGRNGTHLRVGAYADLGLFNFSTRSAEPSIYFPYVSKWDFATFQTKPVWFSDAIGNYYLHNFSAGLKFTILFTFPGREKCVMCGLRDRNRKYR